MTVPGAQFRPYGIINDCSMRARREEAPIMPHPRYPGDEIGRIGHELYEKNIRAKVETEENIGKIISIDIETGDYEIGDDVLQTAKRLLAKNPDAPIWTERVGYDAVYTIGGTLNRTS
jgi:hypothetical protein